MRTGHQERDSQRQGSGGSSYQRSLHAAGGSATPTCQIEVAPRCWLRRRPLLDHPVERAQTHGAGDVFTGALAARLAGEEPLSVALRYANAAAALHVGTAEGEREALGPAEVEALLTAREGDPAGG